MNTTDDAEQVSVSLSRQDWDTVRLALLLTAMRTDWQEEAERILEIAPKVAPAGSGDDMIDAAELEAREALGVPAA